MEILISGILGLLIGGIVIFVIKRMQDNNKKKSARFEAERIVNKANSEAAKLKKDSENKAKDFESRARKNVEQDIHKQKSTLKNKEAQLDRRLKEIEDQFSIGLNEQYLFNGIRLTAPPVTTFAVAPGVVLPVTTATPPLLASQIDPSCRSRTAVMRTPAISGITTDSKPPRPRVQRCPPSVPTQSVPVASTASAVTIAAPRAGSSAGVMVVNSTPSNRESPA
jgi:hypothetical protein